MINDSSKLITTFQTVDCGELLIVGNKIPEETAHEIIRRTDLFVKSSFLDSWSSKFKELPPRPPKIPEDWKYLNLKYLHNDYICPIHYVGFQGWCHPDGTIYSDFNAENIVPQILIKEADMLAREFPNLRMLCIVFNRGFADFDRKGVAPAPIYAIDIKDERVTPIPPEGILQKLNEFTTDPIELIVNSWLKKGKENRYNTSLDMSIVKSWY